MRMDIVECDVSAAEASDKRSNLDPPYIASHECGEFMLHVLSPWWGTRLFAGASAKPRKPTPHENRLVAAHDTVKRRIRRRYVGRYDPMTGANPDKHYAVRCWACREAWLPRGGGETCIAETEDGVQVGFDVCKGCAADRGLLERKAREALADPKSPARL